METSLLLQPKSNAVIIDGCAQLCATSQPINGTVKDLVDALHHLVLSHRTASTDIHLVCNRHYKCFIKSLRRTQRTGSIASNHVLLFRTPVPSKEDTILSTGNKVQFIDIISKYLIGTLANTCYPNKQVVTLSEDILV